MIRGDGGLIGRAAECTAVDALLAEARAGSSGTLLVTGPTGIGKSTLLDYAAQAAGDFRVCRSDAVESEMTLGFAAVQQAITPLLDMADHLPDTQRRALDAALGIVPEGGGDVFLVGLAVLTLLTECARDRPVLVIVDDAQWLDAESATALSFVGRRLHADHVVMLAAAREMPEDADHFHSWPRLPLAALSEADAVELVRLIAGAPVDPAVARRIASESEGNPLALVELASALDVEQLRGAVQLPHPLPIDRRLTQLFTRRAKTLHKDAQMVLLLAAAERSGDPVLLRRAADHIGPLSWEAAIRAVEESGLVSFQPSVSFRHPITRSAIYYAASPERRRAAHAALAEALDGPRDSSRRAWHLGASATEADEDVASQLELAADSAFARGSTSEAASHLRRAAELTPDQRLAAARYLESARAELTLGNRSRARTMLDRATDRGLDERQRVEEAWTRALISLVSGRLYEMIAVLTRALPVTERDPHVALGACLAADAALVDGGYLVDEADRRQLAEATREAVSRGDVTAPIANLIEAVAAQVTAGSIAAAPTLRRAVDDLRADRSIQDAAGRHVHLAYLNTILAATTCLDVVAWDELTAQWIDLVRSTGALAALPLALGLRSWLEIVHGHVRSAESHLAEAEEMVSVAGSRGMLGSPPPAQVLLHAWHGDEQAAQTSARHMMQDAHERGEGSAIAYAYSALTILEIGSARYEGALRMARRVDELDGACLGTLSLGDIVEAAARTGANEVAEAALEKLATRVRAFGTPWAEGTLARARAILSEGDSAERQYRTALDHFAACRVATDLARTQLLYGEWLRRSRRRRDARQPLNEALEFFERIGATAFAGRARQELAATGEHIRTRTTIVDELTPQEAEVARLAVAGFKNQDIAAQLYISTSTVEYHLRKVFVKLQISSRTQLAGLDLPH